VERVHGHEISLITEIVNNNETKNLFPFSDTIQVKKVEKSKKQLFDPIPMIH
jgi:hypothetical protein